MLDMDVIGPQQQLCLACISKGVLLVHNIAADKARCRHRGLLSSRFERYNTAGMSTWDKHRSAAAMSRQHTPASAGKVQKSHKSTIAVLEGIYSGAECSLIGASAVASVAACPPHSLQQSPNYLPEALRSVEQFSIISWTLLLDDCRVFRMPCTASYCRPLAAVTDKMPEQCAPYSARIGIRTEADGLVALHNQVRLKMVSSTMARGRRFSAATTPKRLRAEVQRTANS